VFSVLAIVFGHIALRQLKTDGKNGRTMAVVGLVTGYIGLAFFLLFLALIIFGMVTAPGTG
jgi:hypothetical protein